MEFSCIVALAVCMYFTKLSPSEQEISSAAVELRSNVAKYSIFRVSSGHLIMYSPIILPYFISGQKLLYVCFMT